MDSRATGAQPIRAPKPPEGLLPYRPARVRPYLYSEEEIRRLLQAALELASLQGLASKTYYCLLGLSSVTGLRISEAFHLRYEDVDLTEGILVVQSTKFGKSRFVPIHTSTRRVLCDYAAHRARFLAGRPASFFFVSRRGTRLPRA